MKKYIFFPDEIYFLTYRTTEFKPYLKDNRQKDIVLRRIIGCEQRYNKGHFAYSIQDNHLHLLSLVEDPKQFSIDLQQIIGGSAFQVNKSLNRNGALWGRHFALPVHGTHNISMVLAYILGNPIRHGNIKTITELYDYPYCNYKNFCDMNSKEAMEALVLGKLKSKAPIENEELFWETVLAGSPHS
ncbi:MAG: hypothetical protein V1763_02280 [Parcubacteria group bacterium]